MDSRTCHTFTASPAEPDLSLCMLVFERQNRLNPAFYVGGVYFYDTVVLAEISYIQGLKNHPFLGANVYLNGDCVG
jgi:hypothetical protein